MNLAMNFMKAVAVIVSVLISDTISAIEITGFQPAIVPIHSVTTLNVATAGQLNANSTIQCRFNDISMPAKLKDSMVFCKTPPLRQIDKAVFHLEVDGKLFKAKKQLRLHEPFKVTGISPEIASPSEQLAIKVSGITCEKWMTFFVRFQTANGTKRTQKGICNNSTVTCYIPEFPAHALLRVGVTLSNRIVEWSSTKLRIQYPIDSMRSSLKDLQPNIQQSGAFTFKVALRDKFQNPVSVPGDSWSDSLLSIQYSPFAHPKQFHFLSCGVSVIKDKVGSAYKVGCHGAKHERILIYPSVNNVPVGGTASYEVRTTLCPGKTSCDDNSSLIIIVSSSLGTVFLVVFGVLLYKTRQRFRRKLIVSPEETSMELNECQGNQMPFNSSIENLPESHANETVISSHEDVSEQTDDTKSKSQNIENRLKTEPRHDLKEEKSGELTKEIFLSSVENVPEAHVNVALSTEDREDTNEAKSPSESNTSTEHGLLNSTGGNDAEVNEPVGLAKEVILENEDETETLELQEMEVEIHEMSTAALDLDEKV